jgi:hypothetical protein
VRPWAQLACADMGLRVHMRALCGSRRACEGARVEAGTG